MQEDNSKLETNGKEKNETIKKRLSLDEQLTKAQEKVNQIKERKKEADARSKKRERAERTQRLIRIGAISEKNFNCEGITPEDYDILSKKISQSMLIINNKKTENINLTQKE